MFRRGPILTPDRVATLATAALLLAGAGVLLAVHPAAAVAWIGSTVLMTGTHA